jgi:hypothetical protein
MTSFVQKPLRGLEPGKNQRLKEKFQCGKSCIGQKCQNLAKINMKGYTNDNNGNFGYHPQGTSRAGSV